MADRYSEHAKNAMAAVKKLSKNGKTSFTATETGARRNAIKNLANNPGLGAVVKRSETESVPKGAGAQFRPVEMEDIEGMVRRAK